MYQFSSVTQSCLTLLDTMNRSTPGLPVHHQLPEFTHTHVHRVSDAIQPSHPLSSPSPPSPPAPNPSQHQSLFQWINSSHEETHRDWVKWLSGIWFQVPRREQLMVWLESGDPTGPISQEARDMEETHGCLRPIVGLWGKVSRGWADTKEVYHILLSIRCWITVRATESLHHVWLFATPGAAAHQVPLSLGILQARILEWVAMPSSRGSSWPGIDPGSPALQAISLPSELPGNLL